MSSAGAHRGAMLAPNVPPPEDYYQSNCRLVCTEILSRQAHLLTGRERTELQQFLACPQPAQRLFARILTRKGPWLRRDTLCYSEVGDTTVACNTLAAAGLVTLTPSAPADRLLGLLTKAELTDLAVSLRVLTPARGRALRKAALITELLSGRSDLQLNDVLRRRFTWLALTDRALWDNVRVWYFGDAMQDWSTFVIRDLGMVAYESVPLTDPQFADRQPVGRPACPQTAGT